MALYFHINVQKIVWIFWANCSPAPCGRYLVRNFYISISMNNKKKVLIIDDEVDLCLLLKTYLIRRNYDVYYSHTLSEGLNQFNQVKPDIVFLDNNLPDGTGWEKAADLMTRFPEIQLHLISAYRPDAPEPLSKGFKVWEKPLTLKELDNYIK
jgi:DNA-binding response OmpR family regulator